MNSFTHYIKHLFTPQETNNYRSKILHTKSLTYYLTILVFVSLFIKQVPFAGDVLGFATDISINKLYELTNQEREKNGLPDLKYNDKLAQAAQKKAQDMFAKNYWAHYAPDGTTPWQFILGADYQYEYAGENLAKNFMYSDAVVKAWMNSPSHRENIVRKEYTDIGFAVVNGTLNGEPTTLVVQMFGKPLASSPTANAEEPPVESDKNIQVQTPYIPTTESRVAAAQSATPSFNLLPTFLNLNVLFLSLFAIALFFDFYFAAKLSIVRIGGKNMAHFIFIIFILAGTFVVLKGSIL